MWGEDWGTMIWGGASALPLFGPFGLIALLLSFLAGGWLSQGGRRLRGLQSVALVALVAVPLAALARSCTSI